MLGIRGDSEKLAVLIRLDAFEDILSLFETYQEKQQ
jgi:hypothetical protein